MKKNNTGWYTLLLAALIMAETAFVLFLIELWFLDIIMKVLPNEIVQDIFLCIVNGSVLFPIGMKITDTSKKEMWGMIVQLSIIFGILMIPVVGFAIIFFASYIKFPWCVFVALVGIGIVRVWWVCVRPTKDDRRW